MKPANTDMQRHCGSMVVPMLDGPRDLFVQKEATPDPRDLPMYHAQTFDLDKIVEQVWHHVHEVEKHHHRRAEHLLMGVDVYGPFLNNVMKDVLSFQVPMNYMALLQGPGDPEWMFAGMQVHLIPWMLGCVALPALQGMARPGRQAGINPWAIATSLEEIVIPAEQVKVASIPPEGLRVMEGLRAAMVRWLLRPANILHVKVPGMEVRVG